MSRTREEPVNRANGEPSSATRLTPPEKRPSSPWRKARIILLGLWRAGHDFNVAYKMVVSAAVGCPFIRLGRCVLILPPLRIRTGLERT